MNDPDKTRTKTKGIRLRNEPRYHLAPWQLALYFNAKETRSFHATEKDAIKAKGKADRLRATEGRSAVGFNREARSEYDEAKQLVGQEARLSDIVRRVLSSEQRERRTVTEAVEHLLTAKQAQGVALPSLKEYRSRLRIFSASFGERQIDSLTRNEIVDWLNELALAPRTVWNFYAVLGSLFAYAERRDWIDKNPMRKIEPRVDLPKVRKGFVAILTVAQGKALMRYVERHAPQFIGWACVQYFCGIRDAEAERVRGEWIDATRKKIMLPGWVLEGGQDEGITKTRDDWVMDNLPEALWAWVARYPAAFAKGRLASPPNRQWENIRNALIKAGTFAKWPPNGLRHSFATYHLSAYRNPGATSLLLRHQNSNRLWSNYLAKLVDASVGLSYLSLLPLPAKD